MSGAVREKKMRRRQREEEERIGLLRRREDRRGTKKPGNVSELRGLLLGLR
jgi:hypothetical protein